MTMVMLCVIYPAFPGAQLSCGAYLTHKWDCERWQRLRLAVCEPSGWHLRSYLRSGDCMLDERKASRAEAFCDRVGVSMVMLLSISRHFGRLNCGPVDVSGIWQ